MPVIKRTNAQETMLNNIKIHFPAGPFTREDYKKAVGTRSVPQTKTLDKLVDYGDLMCIDDETYSILTGAAFAVEDKKVTDDALKSLFNTKSTIKETLDLCLAFMDNQTYADDPFSEKGIYRIKDGNTEEVLYVGQTGGKGNGNATFATRWAQHKKELSEGTHHCTKLQNYVNVVLGGDISQLKFEKIESLPSDEHLIEVRERYWIHYHLDTILNTKIPSLLAAGEYEEYNTQSLTKLSQEQRIAKALEALVRSAAAAIHNYLYASIKLADEKKATLIAGIIIALNDTEFIDEYRKTSTGNRFIDKFMSAIKNSIEEYTGFKGQKERILAEFDFIKNDENFTKTVTYTYPNKETKTYIALQCLTEVIADSIVRIAKAYPSYDVMGDFYNEFAKYSGADQQSLGIVLTPHHIADFMSDLLEIKPEDKILDICCGTGALPIAAHRFADNQIIGIEYSPRMMALCIANMIMRGYNSALYLGDSYNETLLQGVAAQKPTKMIINPPYAQDGYPELGFIKRGLDQLEKGGLGVAIVPMSCAIKNDRATKELKEAILDNHQLVATFSMPDQLFYPVGVVTIVMLFRAHCPHEDCSFFGYMKDDGYEITRTSGRQDTQGKWASIKNNMLDLYKDFDEIAGESAVEEVSYEDEWCCEAYMKTDYSNITPEMFKTAMVNYVLFSLKGE